MKLTYMREQLIQALQNFYAQHGRVPVQNDFKETPIHYRRFDREFGTWRKAITVAGLDQFRGLIVQCYKCEKEIKISPSRIKDSKCGHVFCSRSCSASTLQYGRIKSEEVRNPDI